MKKNYFRVDFENMCIVGSKRSIDRASRGRQPEFDTLMTFVKSFPGFKVVASETNKTTHKGLSFRKMEAHIMLQDNADALMEEYEAVKAYADSVGAKYPITKKWFLHTFPEYSAEAKKQEKVQKEAEKKQLAEPVMEKAREALSFMSNSNETSETVSNVIPLDASKNIETQTNEACA